MTEPSELEKHLVQLRADHPDRCVTVVRVRNGFATPCSLLLEPWGSELLVAPGAHLDFAVTYTLCSPAMIEEHRPQ